jgi:hypothetical protein
MNTAGLALGAQAGDKFGLGLSAWNFGRTDQTDLAIGVPLRDVPLASDGSLKSDAGAVVVLYGSDTGLLTTGFQLWTLESAGVPGTAQTNGQFGRALY